MNIATLPRRWTPVALGGCVLWLDAMRASSLYQDSARTTPVANNADPVGGWSDLSGSNHATQSSSGLRGSYSPTGCNGRPGVTFDGVDDVLTTPSVTMTSGTIFCVLKFNAWTTNNGIIKLGATPSDAGSTGRILIYGGASGRVYISNTIGSVYNQLELASSPTTAGTSALFSWKWGTTFASMSVRKNGTTFPTSVSTLNSGSYVQPGGPLPLQIGCGFSTSRLSGCIGEVIALASDASAATLSAAESYLLSKWGLP